MRASVLLPLPRRLRPFLVDLVLTLWTVLELVYLAGLGDISWLPAHPDVRLKPQARAAALALLVGHAEVADVGPARWVFPVWRFTAAPAATERPDALDLAVVIRGAACLQPSERRSPGKLGAIFEERARAVWLARHWSVEEMVEVWARCIARELTRCGERGGAHGDAGRACERRGLNARRTR